MKQISFKMRIALFTGIIVLITSLSLTLVSMYNAKKQIDLVVSFKTPAEENADVTYTVTSEHSLSAEIDDSTAIDTADSDVSFNTYTVKANQASKRFNILSIAAMIIIAAAGMTGAYFFAGKSLKPIKELSNTTLSITENNLDMRLPRRSTKDEISSLTDSFNSMLDRLSDAFEQQKRFSANAAHEFKTPVAVIKAGLQTLMLDDTADIKDYKEVFEVISRNSKRLADIVDDLLTLTNKNADLPLETVSINSMLCDIVRDLTPKYRIKEVEVKYDFESEFFITCPETLAYRLFTNLIENAFKYNKPNGEIILSAKSINGNCEVCIRDCGIGIPAEDMPYIWNSFYCVDTSRSKKLGGTGLGLSVAKEIADRFGWELSAVSTLGEGSEFTVKCKNITD
ncbi:HAMP domain-containing histidine kinase [Lachnospiraceae bacterium MD329]|nr:HAMP domain-containing histidine kinase [Lachnospiraceae bacterium MD329]